jgi:hypothetical protein|tara:strand:- start:14 stop:442 length:429 start_codon:yes stop_codon:yes gene_type:complete
MKKNTVRQGEVSEQIFATKCFAEHSYMVSQPNGTADYDLVVDVNGRLLKIQVKSSIKGDGNVNICKGTNAVKSGKQGKYPYPTGSVDFFAVHNIPQDDWYIIPREVTGDAMNIRVALKREGKYSCYKNNWGFSLDKDTLSVL